MAAERKSHRARMRQVVARMAMAGAVRSYNKWSEGVVAARAKKARLRKVLGHWGNKRRVPPPPSSY